MTEQVIRWSKAYKNLYVVAGKGVKFFQASLEGVARKHPKSEEEEEEEEGTKTTFSASAQKPQQKSASITLLSTNDASRNVKCAEWSSNSPTAGSLLAIGDGEKGRIFIYSSPFTSSYPLKSLATTTTRPCLGLSWNPLDSSQIIAFYEKTKGSSTVLLWDLNSTTSTISATSASSSRFSDRSEVFMIPKQQFAQETNVIAANWRPNSQYELVIGFQQLIKLYDTRTSDSTTVIKTHSSHGCCFSPFAGNRDIFASFSVDIGLNNRAFEKNELPLGLQLWDIRKTDSPFYALHLNPNTCLKYIEWCPTRRETLGGITTEKGRNQLSMWNFNLKLERHQAVPPSAHVINPTTLATTFSWNPHFDDLLMTLTETGTTELVSVWPCFPLSLAPNGTIAFAESHSLHIGTAPVWQMDQKDISAIMPQRAIEGYSLNIQANLRVVSQQKDNTLINFWKWAQTASTVGMLKRDRLRRREMSLETSPSPSPALQAMLETTDNDFIGCSAIFAKEKVAPVPAVSAAFIPIYRSEQRELCMQLCDWIWGNDSSAPDFMQFIASLKEKQEFERASAIAVFNFRFGEAINSLCEGCKFLQSTLTPTSQAITTTNRIHSMEMACLALSGFQSQASVDNSRQTKSRPASLSLWCETCKPLLSKEHSPYIRAMILFLLSQNFKDLEEILKMPGVSLRDKVAFACCFLNTHELTAFISNEVSRAIKEGDIEGVVLCGLINENGTELLQQYVDRTGDIQTACLAGLIPYMPEKKIPQFGYIQTWLSTYRGLLNRWKLWEIRAKLDIVVQPLLDQDPAPQVFARCTFCSRALTVQFNAHAVSNKPSKLLVSHCPSCSKALSRCCVCLLPLDCAMVSNMRTTGAPGREFDMWWSWCQNCGHGGHAGHLLEWFKTHSVCPVTDCPCICRNKDL